jgi:hypothetical protein
VTKSPFLSTALAIIPLAAMALPLRLILREQSDKSPRIKELQEALSERLIPAILNIRSAHPFEKLTITADSKSWSLTHQDNFKQITIPLNEKGELHLLNAVVWPPDTPESALFIELMPDGLETRSYTIWGIGEATEETTLTWDLTQ